MNRNFKKRDRILICCNLNQTDSSPILRRRRLEHIELSKLLMKSISKFNSLKSRLKLWSSVPSKQRKARVNGTNDIIRLRKRSMRLEKW